MGVRRTEEPRGGMPGGWGDCGQHRGWGDCGQPGGWGDCGQHRGARGDGARRDPSEGGRLLSAIRRSGPYGAVRDVVYRMYERRVEAELPAEVTPRHIGVILDGNRRWARAMGLADVNSGHQRGAAKISELLQWSAEAGVEVVTLWLLSTDNLNRPAVELEPLLEIIENTVGKLAGDGWNVKPVGALDLLPDKTARVLKDAGEATSGAPGLIVNVAVGYGGRREIADAVRSLLIEQASRGTSIEELAESLDVEHIAEHLYTRGQPDPDLVIRTSGEQRLSGFMLWQSAHSEFHFCEVHWPDFRRVDFLRAMRSYAARHRRYGT